MALLESVAGAVLLAGANYADYASTRRGVARGAIETSVTMGPNGQRLELVKTLTLAGELALFEAIRRKNKPLAWAFVGSIVATNLLIAHHNDQTLP